MTDVNITSVDTTMTFEDDHLVAAAPVAGGVDNEVEALRQILEPIVMQLIEDNLQQYMAMRG